MKKRIFIQMHYMELGGGEMRLIGLLHGIDYTRYDVDLFVYSHQGELMQFIPKEVNLLPEMPEYANMENPIREVVKRGLFRVAYARLKTKWQYHRYLRANGLKRSNEVYRLLADNIMPYLPSLEYLGAYDLAIDYMGTPHVVLQKVNTKKKIGWLHTDYSIEHLNVQEEINIWSAFDYIVSLSPAVTKSFLMNFPSLENKMVEIDYILSPTFVKQRSELISQEEVEKEMPREENVVRLLSVGRFCEAKNYDNVPDICKRINSQLSTLRSALPLGSSKNSQLYVRWYIIGWGSDEALIRQKIVEAGMEKNVIILGKKANPYPYIKACDIYCQPSRYEGKSITVREAQMLCKPVVIANYPTAKSQIQDGIDGHIVPQDNPGCAKGICQFILNRDLQKSISDYLATSDFTGSEEVRKLYNMMES